jgi:hypothetical protein
VNKQSEWMATFSRWEIRPATWPSPMRRAPRMFKILRKQSALVLRGAFASSLRKIPRKLCQCIPASEYEALKMRNCPRIGASHEAGWIGNATLIRFNKFAMGESFHLTFGNTKLYSVAGPPCGQRCVTFLVRVKKRMLSSPYWLRSPKAEFFQPPWLE